MVARVRERGGRQVYRPLFPRLLLVTGALFGLWWDVDLLARGRFGLATLTTLWLVAALAAAAALFWRPAVVVDADAVELRNVLQDVRVPWGALDGVDTRYALTLVVGERRLQSWAAPARGRPPRRRPSDLGSAAQEVEEAPASEHHRTASGVTAHLVEQHWIAWRQGARTRALRASLEATDADDVGSGAGAGDADAGAGGGAVVAVRWRVQLPLVAGAAALLAGVLSPLLR